MIENWKQVWNTKKPTEINSLQDLINANGYETSGLTAKNLVKFVTETVQKLGMFQGESIYEVGCGSGSLLYVLKCIGYNVGGCDYSESLIETANTLNMSNDIKTCGAHEISVDEKYAWCISFSVFQYFNNLEYAKTVLDKMLEKSEKGIAVFDVNDEEKRDLFYEIRRSAEPNYDEKYKGFEHLFIHKSFWEEYAKENSLKLTIEEQSIPNYKNVEFRYNVYLKK